MAGIGFGRRLWLTRFSQPASDRPLYRHLLARKPARILQLGIGPLVRAGRADAQASPPATPRPSPHPVGSRQRRHLAGEAVQPPRDLRSGADRCEHRPAESGALLVFPPTNYQSGLTRAGRNRRFDWRPGVVADRPQSNDRRPRLPHRPPPRGLSAFDDRLKPVLRLGRRLPTGGQASACRSLPDGFPEPAFFHRLSGKLAVFASPPPYDPPYACSHPARQDLGRSRRLLAGRRIAVALHRPAPRP